MVIEPYPTYDTQQKTSQISIRAIYEMTNLLVNSQLHQDTWRIFAKKEGLLVIRKKHVFFMSYLIESETIANVIFRLRLNHWYFKFH